MRMSEAEIRLDKPSMFCSESPALVVSAPAGLVLGANDVFCQHSGYSEVELLGQPLQRLQPATAAGCLVTALQAQSVLPRVRTYGTHDVSCEVARALEAARAHARVGALAEGEARRVGRARVPRRGGAGLPARYGRLVGEALRSVEPGATE